MTDRTPPPSAPETPLSVACECIVRLLERLPRNPTPQMVAAGTAAHAASPVFEAARIVSIWQAMHDAALSAAPPAAPQAEPQPEAIPIAPVEVVRQALKELLESISECRMDQVTARFAKASVMARAVVDRYKDAT